MKKILCQNCRQKPMEVSYTHIQNGQREDYMLCRSCANKLQMQERFAQFLNSSMFEELFGAMAQQEQQLDPEPVQQQVAPKTSLPAKPANEISVNTSKILALTMDKEAAIAREDFIEAARIQKILEKLCQERE